MKRQEDSELAQSLPLVQVPSDDWLSYVNVPMAYVAAAPLQPLAAHMSIQDLTRKRDRWALIVEIAGALMLVGGTIGVIWKIYAIGGLWEPHQFAFWVLVLTMNVLMLVAGVLGVVAGRRKTAETAQIYMSFLLFFAVVYVLVSGASICFLTESELRHSGKQPGHYKEDRKQLYAQEPDSLPQDMTDPSIENRSEAAKSPLNAEEEDWMQAEPLKSVETQGDYDGDELLASFSHFQPINSQEPFNTDRTFPRKPNLRNPQSSRKQSENRFGKGKTWSKKNLRQGLLLFVGIGMLLSASLCARCVFCAYELVKHSENYEETCLRLGMRPFPLISTCISPSQAISVAQISFNPAFQQREMASLRNS